MSTSVCTSFAFNSTDSLFSLSCNGAANVVCLSEFSCILPSKAVTFLVSLNLLEIGFMLMAQGKTRNWWL